MLKQSLITYLIYATSNRRHLIKETWNDRSDMEICERSASGPIPSRKRLSLSQPVSAVRYDYSKPSTEGILMILLSVWQRKSGLDHDR